MDNTVLPLAALVRRWKGWVFSTHSSRSLSCTVKGGFVGLCILLPGQSQVDTPHPPPVQSEPIHPVLEQPPDEEQRPLAQLPAYHPPAGYKSAWAQLGSTVRRSDDRFMRGQPLCEPGLYFTSKLCFQAEIKQTDMLYLVLPWKNKKIKLPGILEQHSLEQGLDWHIVSC